MTKTEDRNTRYFIDIDLKTQKVIGPGFDQRENLDKGRQSNPAIHRLFLARGQYAKLLERCFPGHLDTPR